MRRLFWQMMMSLDGYMAGPGGEMDWFVTDDEFGQYVLEMGKTIDTIVFGRRTYEMMASYWPTSTDPEAPMMNELPKVVFSRTPSKLSKLDWNNSRVARGSVAEEIAKLKAAPGRDIAMFGSADLASTFNKLGLIDEYRIFVNPVVVGRGLPLFKDAERMPLKLCKTRPFRSGNVLLYYEPAAARRS